MKKNHRRPSIPAHKLTVASVTDFAKTLEAQLRLFEKYPLFFRATHFPETYLSNLGYWGLQCGPGWFPTIERAAATIERELKRLLSAMSDMNALVSVERLLERATPNSEPEESTFLDNAMTLIPYCSEVCEDSGMLRISLVNGFLCDASTWLVIRRAADHAISEAAYLCERCGSPGVYRAGYWHRVYCERCAALQPSIHLQEECCP